MSEFLDNLMLCDNDVVSKSLYRLPDILDITSENPIINFDGGKKDSYLFYVENPIQEQIGYREDLKVFIIKANPYTTQYNREIGQRYDDMNIVDGDTMYFDVKTIVDNDTAFKIGNKKYTGFKDFLNANNQRSLIVRLLGSNCPEIVHYKEIPIRTDALEKHTKKEKFSVVKKDLDRYTIEHLDHTDEDTILFFNNDDGFYEIIGTPHHKDNDTSISIVKIVSKNDTLSKKKEYLEEGLACKKMLINLLNNAQDIRLVLDHQSLNRKPSSYTSPYDKAEHLTADGILTKTFAFIEAQWTELFSDQQYPYMGFNSPGQDTYGRSLGEIYVKIYVDELKTYTWVNAAKYILYHYDKYTEAAPAYTNNPTEDYHNNFLSPAFKLNTYDKRYKEVIDGFTHATSELINERNKWYTQITGIDIDYIKEYSVILGDTVLTVPPMNIRSVTETNHTKIPLLRSKGSIVKSLPRSQKILELDIYFNNEYGINGMPSEFPGKNGQTHTFYMNGLRSLIAQFKLTPFLPIENNYINDALMVDAVTLVNLNVATVPSYPRCLKATLTLAEFNYSIFMPELPESDLHNTFSQSIHYPAMRWYYQRLLKNGEDIKYLDFNSEEYITKCYGSRTALVPMTFKDSHMRFYIPDRAQLQTRLDLMSDPKPIMTQEQLTEEMIVGAKRLGPLINKVKDINNRNDILSALSSIFECSYYNAFGFVKASTGLLEDAKNIMINVPALTIGKWYADGVITSKDAARITDKKNNMLYKMRIEYDLKEDKLWPHDPPSSVTNDYIAKCAEAEAALNSLAGDFGACEIRALGKKDNTIEMQLCIPLPQELAASSYEVRLLSQKLVTTLKLDPEEAKSAFRETDNGQFAIILKVNVPNKVFRENATTHFFELNATNLKVDMDCFGYHALLYLYNIASDEEDTGLGDELEKDLIQEKKDIVLNEAMGLKFNEYDTGEMLVEQIAINYNNTFSNMSLNMIDGKAFQYCGAQDMQIQISLVTDSHFTVESLTHLPELSAEYARTYRKVLNCWPLRIDCELTKLFGVLEVLIENVQTETIPNQPGLTRITLTLSSVDRTVRQKEALSKIDTESKNAGYINNGNRGRLEVKTYFDLKHSLAKAELYPDLELPTVDELHEAGFELYRNKSIDINKPVRTYVDPDFYFIYGQALACEIFRDNFTNAFDQESFSYDLTDNDGAYARYIMSKSEDGKQKNELVNMNDIAKSQKDYYQILNDESSKYDYKDMSKEVYKALNEKERNTFMLGQTLAELGTSFWNMTSDAKLAFTESTIDLLPDNVAENYYLKKEAIIKAIDNFLAVPIEENLPKLFDDTIKPGTDHKKQTTEFEKICSSVGSELYKKEPAIQELLLVGDKEDNLATYRNGATKEALGNILLAYADTYTGESYYTNQNIAILNESDKSSRYSWKAKMYMNKDKKNPIPFARLSGDNKIYPASIDDAIEKGVSFGPFNISLRNGETLTNIYKHKALSKNKLYFLDPYYLEMQRSGKLDQIKEHKKKLLTLTGYGAIALIREMLTLYRYYVANSKILSLYELARIDAYDSWRGGYRDEDANSDQLSDTDKGLIEQAKKEALEEQAIIINDYVSVLKGLSNQKIGSDDERRSIVSDVLGLAEDTIIGMAIIDVKGDWKDILFSTIYSKDHIDNHPAKSMKLLREKFQKLYDDADKDPDVTPETKARYKKLLEVCINYETVDVVEFAQDMHEMMLMFESNVRFSQSYAEQTLLQIAQDEPKMFKARFLAMAFVLIEPETVHPLIMNKNADALNVLIPNVSKPDVSHANSRLRKFMYALDGRKILSLSNAGEIPITLETAYRNFITEQVLIEQSNNPRQYLRDSFYDMIKNDKRGRMLRAFPTYYMFFVDEGREIGLWKLHDNFYSSTAIAEIEITKSRKIAADTAHIVLSNLFNSYTQDDKDFIYDLDNPIDNKSIKYKVYDAFNALFSPRTYFNQQEKERLNTPTPLTSRLTPGTRLHIRMGYGANAAELPIVFNGQIAEIGNGEVCEIVAQGDGAELLNPILDIEDSSDIQYQQEFTIKRFFEEWLTNGATAKTILSSILTSRGYWKDIKKEQISNGYFAARNPYGIAHFGDPLFDKIFKNSECIQNLFEANSGSICEMTKEQAENYVGLEKNYKVSASPTIAINVLHKNTWDIMHICASVAPDYKTAVVPFEMRSSLFMGKGRDYYAYEYGLQKGIEDNNHLIYERRKPFEQYHCYTSYSDIITNNIIANAANVKTNAVGLYQQTGSIGKVKPKETTRLFVDYEIYPEHQKSTVIDTQLWAQGMPIFGNGFFLGINADTDDDVDDLVPGAAEIAWRMTASGLKNAMKDMYEGDLVVMGDPSVKPHDRMLITDLYEEMQGAAWVEAVVHSFNAQTGFTTNIYADCINEIDDSLERNNAMLTRSAVSSAMAAYLTPVALNQLVFRKNMKHINNTIMNAVLKGGLSLEENKHKIALALNLIQIKVDANDLKFLENAIKTSNAFDWAHIGSAGKNLINYKEKQSIKKCVSDAAKALVLKDGHALKEVLLSPFDNIGKKLIAIKDIKTARDVAQLFIKNADSLEDISGAKLADIVNSVGSNVDIGELAEVLSGAEKYDYALNKAIKETFVFNDNFIDNIDKLADHIINSDIQGDLLKQAKALKTLKTSKTIKSPKDLKEIGKALDDCAKACTDTKILKAIGSSADEIKDFSRIVMASNNLKSFIPSIDNIVALVGAGTGPIGVIASVAYTVLEFAVSATIGAYATEAVERYLQNLKVMRIYPLFKNNKVMVAGITGHKGIVVGSPTEDTQGAWTEFVTGLFGAKEPTGLVTGAIQYFFASDKAKEIASRYRTNNGLPDVVNSYDLAKLQADFDANFNKRVATLSHKNKLLKLELNRYDSLRECSQYFYKYTAKSYTNGTGINKQTQQEFIPIASHEAIKRYVDQKLLIFTHDLNWDTEFVAVFGDQKVEMHAFYEDDKKLNLPILREDAIIVLDMLISKYVEIAELNVSTVDLTERIESHMLQLTSATILDSEGYDGTGFVFRLTSSNDKMLEEACYDLCDQLNANKHIINHFQMGSDHVIGLAIPRVNTSNSEDKDEKEED